MAVSRLFCPHIDAAGGIRHKTRILRYFTRLAQLAQPATSAKTQTWVFTGGFILLSAALILLTGRRTSSRFDLTLFNRQLISFVEPARRVANPLFLLL